MKQSSLLGLPWLNRAQSVRLAQTASQPPLSARQKPRCKRYAKLAAALTLALAITACGPATPSATEPSATTESASSSSAPSAAGSEAKVYAKDGVAIAGADPVAYFTQEEFVPGSDYTHEWQGHTWQFASAENRDLFASDPDAYAPQYGGYCAWAVGQNALAAIDPNAWRIVEGKLYLNANKRIQERWSKDIPGNIALADANWPTLSQ